MSKSIRCLRNFLIVYATCLFFMSIGEIVYGSLAKQHIMLAGEVLGQAPYGHGISITLIVFGVITISFVVMACIAAIQYKQKLIFAFAILMAIIFVVKIGMGISVAASAQTLNRTSIREHFPESSKNLHLWNTIQIMHQCCGADGPDDWVTPIPSTCCYKVGIGKGHPDPRCVNLVEDVRYLHDIGCMDLMNESYRNAMTAFAALIICNACLKLFGIGIALALGFKIMN